MAMIDPLRPEYENTPAAETRPRFGYAPVQCESRPRVTVVTPFYNTGEIFHDTARSLLGQSFQDWEWLIVNDRSTEPRALEVLDRYRSLDPRIRVLDHDTNQGPGAARNTAYRAARGDYVVQLDSDNLLEPTAIEKWFWFLESHPEHAFVKGYSVGFDAQEYLWTKGFHDADEFLQTNLVDATSMVRRSVHQAVGGYDESIRDGLEDWDFWLRCADSGAWGSTVPEYLDWYRRRPTHSDRWSNWDDGPRQAEFRARLRSRYPGLWNGGFPRAAGRWREPREAVPHELPCPNRLAKENPRMVLVAPWLTMGGADKFNLDLVERLTGAGWEVSVVTTLRGDHGWLPRFARHTPDIFVLHRFLREVDYPRFLRYLIQSRDADVVMVSHSELGYLLLPYLRGHCPNTAFVDYCHIEEEHWKSGGYPRYALDYQELLDLTMVTSEHLKRWMVERGADSERVAVRYINVDAEWWRPDPATRGRVRGELDLEADHPVVLFAGRICPQKQPRVLAETLSRLRDRGVDFTALVAGDGPDLAWLRGFVRDRGLEDRVRLLGSLSVERMRDVLQASDVFFLPSAWEGIALSLYEAMACALPVVGADVGGQSELVTPECGVLLPRCSTDEEVEAYADALDGLLADPGRRRALGEAGRARVKEHFPLDQMGEGFVDLLDRARELQRESPRPVPSPGLARACAIQAVEHVRLSELADRLWEERDSSRPGTRAYELLVRLFEPLYRWGVARGWTWLPRLRARLRVALLRAR
jgi:glycosyltransferase involved in cell wall biosynthesis